MRYSLYGNSEPPVIEWDEKKEQLNFQKHGIRFKTAAKILLDPNLLIREDVAHSKEVRYNIIGKAGKVLFAVITIPKKNTIRIISARLAVRSEKELYYHESIEP